MFSRKASHPHKYKPRDICDPRIPPIYESCRGISAFFLCNGAIKQKLIKKGPSFRFIYFFFLDSTIVAYYSVSDEMIVRPSPETRKNASSLVLTTCGCVVTRGANEQCLFRPRMFEFSRQKWPNSALYHVIGIF